MTKTGRVYKIVHNQSDLVYIGSTLNQLKYRWRDHKNSYKKWPNSRTKCAIYEYFDEYGIENFICVLIKEYEVEDRAHLRAYEQLWINKLRCVNKQCAFQPIPLKEYKKQYYKNNQQKLKEISKQYYNDNKQKLSEYKKQYRKDNQQKLKEKNKQYYKDNQQQILERVKQYQRDNQQKISEKKKEKIECEYCASYITKQHLKRHQRSAKCRSSLNTL